MSLWLADVVGPGFAQALQITEVLFDRRTPYQHVQVAAGPTFGRMLLLDDAVQTTEADEHVYHEMLVHPALLAHPDPRSVLIIGGGDGGTLEEVLKHPVQTATMVEIDGEVVDACRRYLPGIGGDAFADPRTRLRIADGLAFVRQTAERFDAILVDSTDPKGPGTGLFAPDFYRACAAALAEDGILAAQSGSWLYQRALTEGMAAALAEIFPIVRTWWAAVPSYPGALWTFTCASRRRDPRALTEQALARRLTGIPTRYYTPAAHAAAFVLPAAPGR